MIVEMTPGEANLWYSNKAEDAMDEAHNLMDVWDESESDWTCAYTEIIKKTVELHSKALKLIELGKNAQSSPPNCKFDVDMTAEEAADWYRKKTLRVLRRADSRHNITLYEGSDWPTAVERMIEDVVKIHEEARPYIEAGRAAQNLIVSESSLD